MKKLFTAALLALPVVLCAQPKDITGKKFTKLDVGSAYDVILTQGSEYSIRFDMSPKFYDIAKVDLSGETVRIYCETKRGKSVNVREDEKLNVYVTMPSLEALTVSGSVDMDCRGQFNQDDFSLTVSGASDLNDLNVVASGTISVTSSGACDIENARLVAKEIKAVASGSCDVDIKTQSLDRLSVRASGAVDFSLDGVGTCAFVELTANGSADLEIEGISAQKGNITASGSADIEAPGTFGSVAVSGAASFNGRN